MPNLSRWLLVLTLLLRGEIAHAQWPRERLVDSVQVLAERGLAGLTVAPIDEAIALLERALRETPTDSVLWHYHGYAWYRKGSVLFSDRRTSEAKTALDTAEQSLTRASKTLAWPENVALLGATLGQKIAAGVNPFTAMRLGRRSNSYLDAAAEQGPRNPRVFLVRGIGALFKPKLFGGGVDKAATEIERALQLFEADSAHPPYPAWGRSEVYQWTGMIRARQGRTADARAAYLQALELNPGNVFVRDSLLASLDKTGR